MGKVKAVFDLYISLHEMYALEKILEPRMILNYIVEYTFLFVNHILDFKQTDFQEGNRFYL